MSDPVKIEMNTLNLVLAIEERFKKSRKTWADFFQQQTALLVKKIALVTPPGSPVKVSQGDAAPGKFGQNKKRGEQKLKKNILQIFTADRRKLVRSGRYLSAAEKTQIIARNSQLSEMKQVHDRMRNGRGVINRGQSPFFVVTKTAISRYFANRKKRIGYLSGGWIPAANKTGAKGMPAWVTRHTSPGAAKLTIGNYEMILEASNQVGFASDIERLPDRVQWACSLATSDLMKQIAKHENRRVRL
jgi:hypothetical protein